MAFQYVWNKLKKNTILDRNSMRQWQLTDGKIISGLNFRGVSKAGSLSWSGYYGGAKVKIYQAFSPAQADFIQKASEDAELAAFFPTVIFRKEEYLVVEWVEGKSLQELKWAGSPKWIDRIVNLQGALHDWRFRNLPLDFDYSTFLIRRLLKYLGPFEPTPAISTMLNTVRKKTPEGQICLCHFDMSPVNMVVDRMSGKLKLIDNEFLTQSSYYPMDFFNTYHSLPLQGSSSMQRRYLEAYLERCTDLDFVVKNKHFFQALWGIRVIGAVLQSGQYDRALAMADGLLDFEHTFFTALEKK